MATANQYSQLSPGVLISELDLSTRVEIAVSTTGAMVFAASRGTLNPHFSPTYQDFVSMYGQPNPAITFAHDCARAFLSQSSQLWSQRVVNGALHAGLTYIYDSNSFLAPVGVGRLLSTAWPLGTVNGYAGGAVGFLTISLSAALITANSFTMTITDGATVQTVGPVVYATSHNNTMILIAAAIQTAMSAFGDSSGSANVLVETTSGSTNNFIIKVWTPLSKTLSFSTPVVTLGSTQATCYVNTNARLFDVFAENPGVWGNNIGVKITNVDVGQRQRFSWTFSGPLVASNVVTTVVNGTPITTTFATNSNTTLAAFATALASNPAFSSATVVALPGASNNERIVTAVAAAAGPTAVTITGTTVTLGSSQPSVLVQQTLSGVAPGDEFDFEVYDVSNVNLPINRYRVSLDKAISPDGTQSAIDSVVNVTGSNNLNVRVVIPDVSRTVALYGMTTVVNNVATIDTVVNFLGGGNDGATVLNSQIVTGWNAFVDRDVVPCRILINCGYTDVSVQQQMVAIATYRHDAMAILDMPTASQNAQSAYNYRMFTINIDSSFGAIYTPDLLIQDTITSENRYVPPSGHVAGAYAYSDANAAVWFAPAGLNRGKLPQVLGLRTTYVLGDRELLDPVGVNCIINKPGVGPVIWGEETLQHATSVLSSVHARRLLNMLEIAYSDALDYTALFEPNNPFTQFNVIQVGEGLLDPIKRAGGLYDYQVVCDSSNNPPDIVDQDLLRVDIYLKIVRTAKRVLLRAVLEPTGASFAETIQLVNSGA